MIVVSSIDVAVSTVRGDDPKDVGGDPPLNYCVLGHTRKLIAEVCLGPNEHRFMVDSYDRGISSSTVVSDLILMGGRLGD